MTKSKNTRPGVTDITWALMKKWASAYGVPEKALYSGHFAWAVELAKTYHEKASTAVIERRVGAFLEQ